MSVRRARRRARLCRVKRHRVAAADDQSLFFGETAFGDSRDEAKGPAFTSCLWGM